MKLYKTLFGGKTEERSLTMDDYISLLQKSQGQYPIGWMNRGVSGNGEEFDQDFQNYIYQAYRSNGIVFACMLTRQLIFSEARFQYQRMRGGRPGDLWGNEGLSILENPWPNGTTGELLSRAIQDADLAGNHYVLKEAGRVRRLRPDWVRIILTEPPDEAVKSDVAGYVYMPGGHDDPNKWEFYPIEDNVIAHWSPLPDPDALYKGMSWITPVLRDIFADVAATRHKAKFFENAATPNLAVSFKETVTNEQFNEFMEKMDATKGGVEHAYETLYLGGGADVSVIGADMSQMNFKATQGAGETRIAMAARVPAVILGASEGLSGSSLNAGNYNSAKKQFGDGMLRPYWRSISAAYAPLVNVPRDSRLWYDDRDIEYLRQDRKDVAEIQARQAQVMNVLTMAGFKPDTIVKALQEENWDELVHTGLVSVQLLPPGTVAKPIPGTTNDANPPAPAKPAPVATPTPNGKPKPTPAIMPKKQPKPA